MTNNKFDEAARWFAVSRRGVMSLEERSAWQAWMRIPANRRAFSEMKSTWDALETAGTKVSRAYAHEKTRRRPARAMMLAVACIASLGIGIASYDNDAQFWTSLDWSNR